MYGYGRASCQRKSDNEMEMNIFDFWLRTLRIIFNEIFYEILIVLILNLFNKTLLYFVQIRSFQIVKFMYIGIFIPLQRLCYVYYHIVRDRDKHFSKLNSPSFPSRKSIINFQLIEEFPDPYS